MTSSPSASHDVLPDLQDLSSEHPDQASRRPSHSQSPTRSESHAISSSSPTQSPVASSKPQPSRHFSTPRQRPTDDEPRRCWICFADETEDTPTSTAWRSPCPCALTAHESCLLDWVADLEAPNRKGKRGSKIQCPQCKAEIAIARPKSWVIEVVRAAERVTGKLIFPVLTASVLGCVVLGLTIHGIWTVRVVFGKQDLLAICNIHDGLSVVSQEQMPSSQFLVSLPLIPIVLILSRTTLADSVLPLLPLAYLAGRRPTVQRDTLWPPSAGLAFASLPFARALYNTLHKRFVLPRQTAWLKEIQPRSGEDSDGIEEGGHAGLDDRDEGDGEAVVDIELGVEVVMDDDHDDRRNQGQEANEPHQLLPAPHIDQGQAAPQPQEEPLAPPAIDAGGFPALANRQQNIILSTTRLGDLIVGALLFPAVSTAMGQLIALSFPHSWVSSPGSVRPSGMLQSRWGRTIVGGCAFVVMKDVVLGYSRYRLAHDHRRRRVIDYKKEKGPSAVG